MMFAVFIDATNVNHVDGISRHRQASKQASLFAKKKQYYDNIIKYKQCNGRLPEGNPSIELVAYSKI